MTTPTVSDVHIPIPEEKISVKVRQKYFIDAIPIFKSGKWKGTEYTIDDLDEIVKNTNALIKAGLHEPPIKLGHDENQKELLNKSGLPSFGFVKRLYRIGDEIFADVEVPKEVAEWVERRFYDKVSSEIYLDYEHPKTGEKIGKVLRAIAFLGADLPAVKGLGSIMFHNEKKIKKDFIVFEDKNLEEVNNMKLWTLDEVKRILPCCYDFVSKYMEEKNKKEIDGDELAELIVKMRYEKTKQFQEGETDIECPEGYKWDVEKGKCVRLDEKQEDRVVCPKGYEYNKDTGKCEPVKQAEESNPENKTDKTDETNDDIDEEVLYGLLEKILEKIEDFQLPGGEPKGWTKETFKTVFEKLGGSFDDCVEEVKARGIADDPERFCAWLKYRATGKWPGTKEWRAEENVDKTEQEKAVQELKEKIKELEDKKFDEEIEKLKTEYRNILLPKFDEYITIFREELKKREIAKFGEQEVDLRKLFIDFLKDIITSKIVMFDEIAKTPKTDTEYEISEEKKQKIIQLFNEIKPNTEIKDLELAELALQISNKENIPYRDALIKAKKILQGR